MRLERRIYVAQEGSFVDFSALKSLLKLFLSDFWVLARRKLALTHMFNFSVTAAHMFAPMGSMHSTISKSWSRPLFVGTRFCSSFHVLFRELLS